MRFDVITIFPEMFDAITRQGITARAIDRGLWRIGCWNPRDHAADAYRSIDDRPYGGGPGMVLKPDVPTPQRKSCPSSRRNMVMLAPAVPPMA